MDFKFQYNQLFIYKNTNLKVCISQLIQILKNESKQILEEFKLASIQGDGTSQEVADFRENVVQSFVARFYPQSHIVSKGKITDLDGNQSASIDCLILNPAHPNLIDSKGKFRLILADGCDAAIEVKPNIARKDELHRSLEQGISVKKTKRTNSSILLQNRCKAEILEHALHIPFIIFSVKAFSPQKLYSEIINYYSIQSTPIELQIDAICILGIGILKNIKYKELNHWSANFPMGQNSGWYFEKWEELTLIGFLLHLEQSYSSFPDISEPVMSRILKKISSVQIERLYDCV